MKKNSIEVLFDKIVIYSYNCSVLLTNEKKLRLTPYFKFTKTKIVPCVLCGVLLQPHPPTSQLPFTSCNGFYRWFVICRKFVTLLVVDGDSRFS